MSDFEKNDFNSMKDDAVEVNSTPVGDNQPNYSTSQPYEPTQSPTPQQEQPIYNDNMQTPTPQNSGYYSNDNQQQYGYSNGYTPPVNVPQPKKKKNKGITVIVIVLAVCLALGLLGIGSALISNNGNSDNKENTTSSSSANLDIKDSPKASDKKSDSDELTTIGVVKKVKTSCVGITVQTTSQGNGFYGNLGESTTSGEGSGVLMLEDNGYTYIATCAHVIDTANSTFKVTMSDGETTYDAELVGYDSQTDIGVLRIKATGLNIAEFGDSDVLQQGQTVIAIGNPGGIEYANSVTQGVISAIDRPVNSQIGYKTSCIQHDAAINPGNSGGALFNSYGQVIGINSSKIASTEYEGMGFAIPSKTVQEVVNSIIANGYVSGRAQIGIKYVPLEYYQNYSSLVAMGLPSGSIVISSIEQGSGLINTQTQINDIIVAVDGEEMSSADILTSKLSSSKPGDTMTLKLARINNNRVEYLEVSFTLTEAKGN